MIRLRVFRKRNRRIFLRSPIVRSAAGLFVLILPALLPAAPAGATSVASLTARGNEAYAGGDYKKALGLYEQATGKDELPIISYDRGNALYRLGRFEEARKAYDKAVGNLKNAELATRGYYNMGNADYRQGEAQQKQAPDKAMRLFSESAAAYREALRREPAFTAAGANLEMANRKIKELAALKKQQQAEQQQSKSSKQGKGQDTKALKDLADQQKQLAEQTEKQQNTKQDSAEERQKTSDSLAANQEKLRRQTEKKAQADNKAGSPQTQKDLQDAAGLQKKAEKKLRQDQLAQAAKLQKKAAEKLQKAAAQAQQNKKKQEKQADKRPKQGKTTEKQAKQQPSAANKKGADVNKTADQDQNPQASPISPQLDPRQILNREKIQRQLRRQRMTASGSLRVDKDW